MPMGSSAPKAAGDHPPGATSCYVGDNTDVVILREASRLTLKKCAQVVKNLAAFAEAHRDQPCLGYTICSLPSSPPWASRPPCGSMS